MSAAEHGVRHIRFASCARGRLTAVVPPTRGRKVAGAMRGSWFADATVHASILVFSMRGNDVIRAGFEELLRENFRDSGRECADFGSNEIG